MEDLEVDLGSAVPLNLTADVTGDAIRKLREVDPNGADELRRVVLSMQTRMQHLSDHVEPQLRELEQKHAVLQERLKQATRINAEYFDVIERIERQRNEWVRLYHEQASSHHAAQVTLESWLQETRNMLRKALDRLNDMRKAQNLEPVKRPDQLDAELSHAAQYRRMCERLQREAAPLIDGLAEVNRIVLERGPFPASDEAVQVAASSNSPNLASASAPDNGPARKPPANAAEGGTSNDGGGNG